MNSATAGPYPILRGLLSKVSGIVSRQVRKSREAATWTPQTFHDLR